jgi:hypothetical protein
MAELCRTHGVRVVEARKRMTEATEVDSSES